MGYILPYSRLTFNSLVLPKKIIVIEVPYYDRWVNAGKIANNENGDTAADQYHRYKVEDTNYQRKQDHYA